MLSWRHRVYSMESASWKRSVLRAIGFGVGLAAGLVLLSAGVYWLTQRPQPWSTTAITAGPPELSMATGEIITFKVRYPLTNHTKADCTLPVSPTGVLFFKKSDDGSLLKVDDATWDGALTIPPGQTIDARFEYQVKLSDYDTSLDKADLRYEEWRHKSELSKFLNRRLQEVAGFVFFDYQNRYNIDLPRNWPLESSRF